MKVQNSEEINGYVQFYNEIKKIILPRTFDEFQEKLKKMLQIESDLISSLIISYRDEDNDKVMVNSGEDYLILLEQIKNRQANIIIVEKDENANIDIDNCSQSLINFKEKNEKNNEANNNLNIVSNQQFEINKQENKIEKINIDIKNNNDINNNDKNNINNFEEKNNELEINNNKEFYNNIDNNLNDSNSEEEIMSPYLQKEKEQKNELNNNNNINIINQINDINANANVNLNQTYLVFNIACSLCNQFPIIKILYYCPTCSVYICPECENKPDINHRHSILKIQTQQQYSDLMEKINNSRNGNLENNQSNLAKIKDNIKDSVLKIFGNNKEEVNIPQQNLTSQMSIIQIARAQYGLEGISDEQLQDAIRKTNGNIENAIPLLFK